MDPKKDGNGTQGARPHHPKGKTVQNPLPLCGKSIDHYHGLPSPYVWDIPWLEDVFDMSSKFMN